MAQVRGPAAMRAAQRLRAGRPGTQTRCGLLQVVCIKQVPDTETRVKVGGGRAHARSDGRHLDREPVRRVRGRSGAAAQGEAGRRARWSWSRSGGAGVQTTLRNALAMGADRAIHLKTDVIGAGPARGGARARRGDEGPRRRPRVARQAGDGRRRGAGRADARGAARPAVRDASSRSSSSTGRPRRSSARSRAAASRSSCRCRPCSRPTRASTSRATRRSRASWPRRRRPSRSAPPTSAAANLEVLALELPPARAAGRIVGEGAAAVPELVRVLREEAKVI